jgi:GAF domain-containing protein
MDEALVRAIETVQEFVGGTGDVEQTLREVAELATGAVGADMAGLTIRDERGRATTVVYTDRMVPEIDQAQYDNDRGPCLDASRAQQVFRIDDTMSDSRWPEFAKAARTHGVRSSLSIPVVVAARGLGALNFYDGNPSFFDAEKTRVANLFAAQCAITAQYWAVAHEATTLADAMQSRAVIEQAKGVIMATTRCPADDAFDLLRDQSMQENRKLRDIAAEIVDRQTR